MEENSSDVERAWETTIGRLPARQASMGGKGGNECFFVGENDKEIFEEDMKQNWGDQWVKGNSSLFSFFYGILDLFLCMLAWYC